MKDYVVTAQHLGTLNFLPRIVRTDNPRTAVEATCVDMELESVKIRKQRVRKYAADDHRTVFYVTGFGRYGEVFYNFEVSLRTTYYDRDYPLAHHVRIKADGTHVHTVHPERV